MNFNLIFSHPWWFILFCILTGLAATAILYYKNRSDDFQPWKQWLLAAFRFVVVTVICFLLLAPLLQLQITNTQEPVILIFQDNTQSLTTHENQSLKNEAYLEDLSDFRNNLSASFNISTYAFGQQVRQIDTIDFQDKITDMSEIFTALDVMYSNRNVGAIIIAGDGIYNRGQNPLFKAANLMFPVYTIAMGDTLPRRDLIINRIQHNRITYLNNIFPLEVTVEARQAAGSRSRIRVIHQGQTVFEQNLTFASDSHFQTIPIELEATEVGIKRYRIELEPIEGEISLENNVREFFIEVIDSRQKILIMAASPHPDVGALKQALDTNENYENEVILANEFQGNIREYDIIVWHQLPSAGNLAIPLINQATEANIPQLFVIGAQSNINAINRLQTGVQFNIRSAGFNDSRAEVNTNFTLFQLGSQSAEQLPLFSPLQTPFAAYNLSPGAQILAYQKIGNVLTDYPLIAFSHIADRKTGFVTGEGIWRWRLNDFANNNNHDIFNDLVSRMMQFLAVVDDKSFFRVNTNNFLYENEPAIFEAELYNASYELVNTPDVFLTITNEEGTTYDYTFGKTTNSYRLNAGTFPFGEYRYRANTQLGNEEYKASGIFTVSPLNIEGINTVANHQLLFQLAENTGGKIFYPHQWDELLAEIENRNDIRPVFYTQNEYEDLINLQWIFFLLLLFLSVEWFVRKYSGSY